MAVCARCGTVNPDSSKFCSECGAPLTASGISAAAVPEIPDIPGIPALPPELPAVPAQIPDIPPAAAAAEPSAEVPQTADGQMPKQPDYRPRSAGEAAKQPVYRPQPARRPAQAAAAPNPPVRVNPFQAEMTKYGMKPLVSGQPAQPKRPAPYPVGGLIIWAVATIPLSLIPGLVAVSFARSVNRCATEEQQKRMISRTKLWCIIGTAVSVLRLFYTRIFRG